MTYLLVKALHIVGFVSWFAGLLYFPRLLIYEVESDPDDAAVRSALVPQLALMQRRLWFGITWPAMVWTWVFGLTLLSMYGQLLPWVYLKVALLVLLTAYHLQTGRMRQQLRDGTLAWSGQGLRVWNEVGTLLLVAIVLTASLKDAVFSPWVAGGVAGFAGLLAVGIVAYRNLRSQASSD